MGQQGLVYLEEETCHMHTQWKIWKYFWAADIMGWVLMRYLQTALYISVHILQCQQTNRQLSISAEEHIRNGELTGPSLEFRIWTESNALFDRILQLWFSVRVLFWVHIGLGQNSLLKLFIIQTSQIIKINYRTNNLGLKRKDQCLLWLS